MRRSRRLAVALAVSALVAGGGIGLGLALVANADVVDTCTVSNPDGTGIDSCQLNSAEISMPAAITLVVTLQYGDGQNDQVIWLSWTGDCQQTVDDVNVTTINSPTQPLLRVPISTAAPVTVNIPLPFADPWQCNISVVRAELQAVINGGTTYDAKTIGSYKLELEYTPRPSPTASSSSSSPSVNVPLVKGYDDKCLDDKGNSSANRTEVILWTCNSADSAEGWKFTGGELQHNGKCANDQGNGGSGTKVILWACNGSSDEKWSHTGSDGEFVLSSTNHGQLCLTDPGHSKANRTQLTVYTCNNTSNQHWT